MLLLAHGFMFQTPDWGWIVGILALALALAWGHLGRLRRGLAPARTEPQRGAAIGSGLALIAGLAPVALQPLLLLDGTYREDLRWGAFATVAVMFVVLAGGYLGTLGGWAVGRLFGPPVSLRREAARVGLVGLLGGTLLAWGAGLLGLDAALGELGGALLVGPQVAVWTSGVGAATLGAVAVRVRVLRRAQAPLEAPLPRTARVGHNGA